MFRTLVLYMSRELFKLLKYVLYLNWSKEAENKSYHNYLGFISQEAIWWIIFYEIPDSYLDYLSKQKQQKNFTKTFFVRFSIAMLARKSKHIIDKKTVCSKYFNFSIYYNRFSQSWAKEENYFL